MLAIFLQTLTITAPVFAMLFLGVLLTVAVAGVFIQSWVHRTWGTARGDGTLLITVPAPVYHARAEEVVRFIREHAPEGRLESVTDSGGEVAISYSFLRGGADALPGLLALEKAAEGAKVNVFFNRAGDA